MNAIEPPPDCTLCPRLVEYRVANQRTFPEFHNAPVRSFGPISARLLIVGLAPGLKGANQTGRPFTGDYAGDLLYQTLQDFGFAMGSYGRQADDGLALRDCRITNAVRCVPPENKPTGPEGQNCRPFLAAELQHMDRLQVILCLGGLSHAAVLSTLSVRKVLHPFGHGRLHQIGHITVADSYHCSRYNTNTRRLTVEMFEEVFEKIRSLLVPLPK